MQDARFKTLNSQLSTPGVAFLWDESFLWGLMAYKALKNLGLPFDLIRAEDVRAGILNDYKMLFVPGGWASNKIRSLGEIGVMAIRNFVSDGGSYLGFCGGAGLATTGKDGIGLLNIKRRPTKERVPSFSGRICLNVNEHPMWNDRNALSVMSNGLKDKISSPITHNASRIFHAWWPSQFIVGDENIKVLATYGDALPDSFSSDLSVGDVELTGDWTELEKLYGINLDPARLKDEPCVLEGRYGKGKVILSLIHFDTPDDVNGQRVLKNLWEYLLKAEDEKIRSWEDKKEKTPNFSTSQPLNFYAFPELQTPNSELLSSLFALCADLISLGERNFLWFWKNSMLLQWRRGVRGLEYNTLYIMMREIAGILSGQKSRGVSQYAPTLEEIKKNLVLFCEKAGRLLVLERHELQNGKHITYEKCDDPEIKKLRSELFSDSKSHGGLFKELIDKMDGLLFVLVESRE